MLKKKRKKIRTLTLKSGDRVLYDGPLAELPLTGQAILDASIRYFNDPEPCEIHSSAARLRIAADFADELGKSDPDYEKLRLWTGLPGLTEGTVTESES
ncbi:MAG: hypothetical protein ACOX8B_00265 [Lachnospiraceae bacterium]|jgi:hypothetical protein